MAQAVLDCLPRNHIFCGMKLVHCGAALIEDRRCRRGQMGRTALPKKAKIGVGRSTSQQLAQHDIRYSDLELRLSDALCELKESVEYQTAISNVLNAISRSPGEIAPVLEIIVETAAILCGADFAFVYELGDGQYQLAATHNAEAQFVKYLRARPALPGRSNVLGRVILERRTVHIDDVLSDPEYTDSGRQQAGKYRTVLGVPLLREHEVIGVITLVRGAVRPFTQKQIDLVSIFAHQ